MREAVNDDGHLIIYSSQYDLCSTCKNKYDCPLMQALVQEIVILHYGTVQISECGLYQKLNKGKVKNGKNSN